MIQVLDIFQPTDPQPYPKDNIPAFEEWFRDNHTPSEKRKYVPIMWTAYYKTYGYGKDKVSIQRIQNFLNGIDANDKYYTVVQFDDGVMVDLSRFKDFKVFSMVGKGDYNLPLICQPHDLQNVPRNIFASFIGHRTHPVRGYIIDKLIHNPKYFISCGGFKMPDYCRVLASSVFSLCPRGYSANSFRIMEAMQQGSIPVWISDDFPEPHGIDFNSYGVKISLDNIDRIHEILSTYSNEDIERLQKRVKEVYDTYYTYEATKKLILENL